MKAGHVVRGKKTIGVQTIGALLTRMQCLGSCLLTVTRSLSLSLCQCVPSERERERQDSSAHTKEQPLIHGHIRC